MNGVQATLLAATPVETGLVLSSPSSKSVRDSSPGKGSFEKQLKKACQVQRENPPSSSEPQEKAEPVKAETENATQENQVDQPKSKESADSNLDKNQNIKQASNGETQTDAQASSPTNAIMAQAMNMAFMGLAKNDNLAVLQQGVQGEVVGAVASAPVIPEGQPTNTTQDLSQLTKQMIEAANEVKTVKTEGSVDEPAEKTAPIVIAANENAPKDLAAKVTVNETAVSGREQNQTGGKMEASGLELQGQVKDEAGLKKNDGEASSAPGKKLTEFESQRASIVRLAKDNNASEGQQQSSTGAEDEPNSAVLQQVEAEIPKVQVRNVPTSVQNNRAVVDPQDLMDQVVKKAEVMIKENSSEMTLQLKPGFLGKMTITIAVDEAGTVTAHFSTSSQQVKNALEQNIQNLRQTLEAQGMKVDKTEVNVQLDSGGMMSDPGGRQQDLWQQPRGISFRGFTTDSEGEITQTPGQIMSATQTSEYESADPNDSYNFLI